MNEEMLLTNIYVRSRVFSGLIHSACGLRPQLLVLFRHGGEAVLFHLPG